MTEPSVADLLAGASLREPMDKHVDSLSGAGFERVVIDGDNYVVKYVGYATDWLARALDDRDCFVLTLWRASGSGRVLWGARTACWLDGWTARSWGGRSPSCWVPPQRPAPAGLDS